MKHNFTGQSGKVHIAEASTNLVDWEAVGTATIKADGTFEFEDHDAIKNQSRFYRVKAVPVNP
jgi:hypothetical protein